jgi:CheY-like chemotaxis protein
MTSRNVVLLVEDDPDTRQMYAQWLEFFGFNVAQAGNGLEGVESARRVHPDVVLMDVAMPKMDGLEATRRLKHDPQTADVPVVILSAFASPQDRKRAFDAGADEFLAKPCDLDLVRARLEHYSASSAG